MNPKNVQIPLWTIVTRYASDPAWAEKGSDSSMDDCNGEQRALRRALLLCSDSSMDDCNGVPGGRVHRPLPAVQIPLWTIVTIASRRAFASGSSSDSSMDDCNNARVKKDFIGTSSSDSSMDDCNALLL